MYKRSAKVSYYIVKVIRANKIVQNLQHICFEPSLKVAVLLWHTPPK